MSVDVDRLLEESATGLFGRHAGPAALRDLVSGDWSPELWAIVEWAEFPLLALPLELGGSGGSRSQEAMVIGVAARHAAAIPLAETATAGWLLGEVGISSPSGPMSAAFARPEEDRWVAARTPYGRHVQSIVVLTATPESEDQRVHVVPRGSCDVEPGVNLAGEARDTLRFSLGEGAPAPSATAQAFEARMALVRAVQLAAAATAVQQMTVRHVCERTQFGRPLAELAVVRDRLAVMAEEAAAAAAAAKLGVADGGLLAAAVAKVRTGRAAGRVAALAHQLHGAVGMTREHSLNHLTRRLWAWRDEAGDESVWSRRIGDALLAGGPDLLWQTIVETGEPRE